MNDVQEKNERGSKNPGGHSPKTEARHRALRDALLDAAARRIAEAGLAELKARDLARDAGCALGAVYTVFDDLDALVLAVNARTLDALEAAVGQGDAVGADPVARIESLALALFAYAAANRQRWAAVVGHRMAGGRPLPDWYAARLARLFQHVEAPLGALCPGLGAAARASLARSLFSAVQGVVQFGLDEKLQPMPEDLLRGHVRLLARALARGLRDEIPPP